MASSSTSSSSISTLSAKARPYVPPHQYLLPRPSQSTLSAKAPPFTNPSTSPSPSPSSSSSEFNTPLVGNPYYPSYDALYDPEFASSAYDGYDVLEPHCDFGDFSGASAEPWNAPYDGNEMELPGGTSMWRVSSLDLQGVRPKVTVPCKITGAYTSALSSHISLSTSTLEPCNDSYSSSNCYKTQITCSTNAKAYYPVSSQSALAQVYAPSAQETSLIADSLSKTVDSSQALPKESITGQQANVDEGSDGRKRREANNSVSLNSAIAVDSCVLKEGISSSSGYGSSLSVPVKLPKTSTSKSDLAKLNTSTENSSGTLDMVDLDVDSPCWKGTLAYGRSPFHVDEVVAPHLTAVRSDVAESPPCILTTVAYNNRKYSSERSESLISNGTKRVSCISHSEESIGSSFSGLLHKPEYPCIAESECNCKVVQHSDIGKEQGTDMMKDMEITSEAQDEVLQLDREVVVTSTVSSRTADDITNPETAFNDAVQNSSSNNQGCDDVDVTTPSVTVESRGPAILSGKTSSATECAQLIDDELCCLRRNLLSIAYEDENALKLLLNDMLLLVNDYHEAFVLKNKQGNANECDDDSGLEADQRQINLEGHNHAVTSQSNYNNIQDVTRKDDAVLNHSKIETCHDIGVQEKMQPIGRRATHRQDLGHTRGMGSENDSRSNISLIHDLKEKFTHCMVSNKSDNLDNLPSDLTIVAGMANDFEKILKKTFTEREEDPRTLLHKNLWIDAQVKLFAMKYELQLTRAELELLKQNRCAKGRLQEATSPQT